jgi:erythromycin esterase
VYLMGFGTYAGEVLAGARWGARAEKMTLAPARRHSIEGELHEALKERRGTRAYCDLRRPNLPDVFTGVIGHRAVGVVFDPELEGQHYVPSIMNKRYDGFFFIDQTTALHSLWSARNSQQIPESWPTGL